MTERSRTENRRTASFLVLFGLAAFSNLFLPIRQHLYDVPALLYCALIMSWSLSIQRRVVHTHIRRLLLAASVLMVLLFFFRICRYSLFYDLPVLPEYAWYAYYTPLCLLPLTGFLSALRVSGDDPDGPLRPALPLWVTGASLSLLFMTNNLHALAFRFADETHGSYSYGPLYWVFILWALFLCLATLVILLRCCRIRASKNLWYVPAGIMAVGIALLAAYFLCGGSPQIHGMKLYQLHEAVCFLFIGSIESCIGVGLLPVNSDYEMLFDRSHINAVIRSDDGGTVIASQNYAPVSEGFRVKEKPITGGTVSWAEDLRDVTALNEKLESLTQELEEENELIRQEKDIRAERISYETKNRLYDRISEDLRPQTETMQAMLSAAAGSKDAFAAYLPKIAVLGAYIKRRANLILNAEGSGMLSSDELALAIRESFEYLELSEKTAELRFEGEVKLPAPLCLLAYEIFESVLMDSFDAFSTCDALIDARSEHFALQLALDAPDLPALPKRCRERLSAFGASLGTEMRDDTVYITLSASLPAGKEAAV